MSKRRKNAGEGYGFMFSGAFTKKEDAVAKEKTRPGSFIKGMPTRNGYRYVVMTPRDNPPKRKNSVAWGKNPSLSDGEKRELTQLWHTARIAGAHTFGERITWASREWDKTHPGQRMRAYKYLSSELRGYGTNPSRPFIGPDGKVWQSSGRKIREPKMYVVEKDGRAVSQIFQRIGNARKAAKELGGVIKLVRPGDIAAGGAMQGGSRVNPGIVEAIRPGDRVTILTPHGQQLTGRAVMRSSSGGWVLNLGGRHGTPGIATEENIVKVKQSRRNPAGLVNAQKKAVAAYRKMGELLAAGKLERSNKLRLQLAKLNSRMGWTMADVAALAQTAPARKNPSVAGEILAQLGGRRFSAMTGAKSFVSSHNSLSFRLPNNFARDGINAVRITLEPNDTYTMKFMRVRGVDLHYVAERDGVYNDNLQSVFTSVTGLDTSLGSMGRGNPHHHVPGRERVPFTVLFSRHGQQHSWERYAETVADATRGAREALEREYPDRDYHLISVKPAGMASALAQNPSILQVGPNSFQVDNEHGTTLLLKPTSWGGWEVQADNAHARVAGRGRSLATRVFNSLEEVERHYKAFRGIGKLMQGENPSELLIMGANPHGMSMRTNPVQAQSDDSRYMIMAAAQLYPGRHLASLSGRELSQVAQLAARLKADLTRHNIYFGFGPAPASEPRLTLYRRPRGVRSRSRHSGESHDTLRALRAEVVSALVNQGYKPAKAKQMAQDAAGSDFSSLFSDALRRNPMCGAMVQGYSCTRKPGHKGPHLPQGATMRTRHRLPRKWQPNPSAEVLREKFTGAAVDAVQVMNEPHVPAGDYALLGKLLSLYVKPRKGGQVQEIRAAGGTTVVSDETARQIYFVGGDQDISSGLEVFGALDRGNGLFELGEARRIDYRQRKEHVDHPEMDSWRHEFGEETGERPTVLYDAGAKRLLLEGGAYVIRAEGIVN